MEINITQLAQFYGVNRTAVNQWLNEGLPYVQKGERGKKPYVFESKDVAEWHRQRNRNSVKRSQGEMTAEQARQRKLQAEAGLAELELAKKEGLVVEIEEIERHLCHDFAKFRAAALKLPERCVIRLVGETDETKIKAIIKEEMIAALNVMEYMRQFDDSER